MFLEKHTEFQDIHYVNIFYRFLDQFHKNGNRKVKIEFIKLQKKSEENHNVMSFQNQNAISFENQMKDDDENDVNIIEYYIGYY